MHASLVALYDIRPGNGEGQFLQPRSLHGALNASRIQNTNTAQTTDANSHPNLLLTILYIDTLHMAKVKFNVTYDGQKCEFISYLQANGRYSNTV